MDTIFEKTKFPNYRNPSSHQKLIPSALAGVAQWIKHWPGNQRVASSIPSCRFNSQSGHRPGLQARGGGATRGNHTLMFLSLFFPPFPSLKINKIFKKCNTFKNEHLPSFRQNDYGKSFRLSRHSKKRKKNQHPTLAPTHTALLRTECTAPAATAAHTPHRRPLLRAREPCV